MDPERVPRRLRPRKRTGSAFWLGDPISNFIYSTSGKYMELKACKMRCGGLWSIIADALEGTSIMTDKRTLAPYLLREPCLVGARAMASGQGVSKEVSARADRLKKALLARGETGGSK